MKIEELCDTYSESNSPKNRYRFIKDFPSNPLYKKGEIIELGKDGGIRYEIFPFPTSKLLKLEIIEEIEGIV